MITVDLNQIPAISAEEAGILVGVDESEFTQPGVYHVLIGSRAEIEEFNFLGDVETIEVPTLDEIMSDYDANDEEDLQEARALFEEFYGLSIEEDHVNFGYTEEGYDVWVKVA